MTRQILVGGVLAAAAGVALIIPAIVGYLVRGFLDRLGIMVVSLGVFLILSGATALRCGFRKSSAPSIPAPVRAAITGNILFLSFFALEFSDGLIRQGGRVFYWTSVLFLPALLLLYGLVSARRWAWWTARGVAAILTLWFVGFLGVIPFADLRSGGEPVPSRGRVYMIGVTLILATIMAYVFRALGRAEARSYFGLLRADNLSKHDA
jgi:hypothetical protein